MTDILNNNIKTAMLTYIDKIIVYFNALPMWSKWAIWIAMGVIVSYLSYRLFKRLIIAFKNWRDKRKAKNYQNGTINKTMDHETQIECSNNKDSKIINNVYNF